MQDDDWQHAMGINSIVSILWIISSGLLRPSTVGAWTLDVTGMFSNPGPKSMAMYPIHTIACMVSHTQSWEFDRLLPR